MIPHYTDDRVSVYVGDCRDVLPELAAESVDAVITDPPYGLEFMGKEWDKFGGAVAKFRTATEADEGFRVTRGSLPDAYRAGPPFQAWCQTWATECLRVLKPGGHLLAFGGTRTGHRLTSAIEDAGFEIRDSIAWLYGSGFPKSLDVSKAIDKAAGAEREVIRERTAMQGGGTTLQIRMGDLREVNADITAPATEDAKTWQGWGTALKPAFEPVTVARKPLARGTVAAQVLDTGTGALNIDACRVGTEVRMNPPGSTNPRVAMGDGWRTDAEPREAIGRWPANVVLDEGQAAALDAMSGVTAARPDGSHRIIKQSSGADRNGNTSAALGAESRRAGDDVGIDRGDGGGASRFFYVAKASRDERPSVDGTGHPTVKPVSLMRWLVRLVTPPGGLVLDPFFGSGTTGQACLTEGMRCIGVEASAEYLPLIAARLARPVQPDLWVGM